MRVAKILAIVVLVLVAGIPARGGEAPFVVVLGVAQDGGAPQTGANDDPRWNDPSRVRHATSIAVVDPALGERWLFDCTPDFKYQLHALNEVYPLDASPGVAGIFLTHAHIGHYTGLMLLGHESMGASGVKVYAMPQMTAFLTNNGPWSQLVRYGNISLQPLASTAAIALSDDVSVEVFEVPHRQEFSEVVGFRIVGPSRSVVYVPDIDSWEEWEELGTRIEDVIATADVLYIDGTFWANGEIPGRDMSSFPHPFISYSMTRFADLPAEQRARIRFIHMNHTNPAMVEGSDVRAQIEAGGFRVAVEGERVEL